MLKSLHDREQGIKDTIEKAEYMKQESEKMLEEHKNLLAKADDESRKIISETREMAEKLRNDLIAKTNDDAHKLIVQAKSEIEREHG